VVDRGGGLKISRKGEPLKIELESDAEIQAFMNLIKHTVPVYAEEKSMQLRLLNWSNFVIGRRK
jgi:hypothetical protein